jgi:O-antigen/teichoic acid export membrane protein
VPGFVAARSAIAGRTSSVTTFAAFFAVTRILVHAFGSVQYGLWALAMSIVAHGGIFDLGIADAVARYVASYREAGKDDDANAVIGAGPWMYCSLAAVLVGATFALPRCSRRCSTFLAMSTTRPCSYWSSPV